VAQTEAGGKYAFELFNERNNHPNQRNYQPAEAAPVGPTAKELRRMKLEENSSSAFSDLLTYGA
jgi:hypothetical protein